MDGVDVDADGLGPALQELVETTTGARLALTSRTMSGQPGERVVRVGPLPIPAANEPLAGPAVDLLTAPGGGRGWLPGRPGRARAPSSAACSARPAGCPC